MNTMKKFAAGVLIAVTISGGAFAANVKWKQLVFTDDIEKGLSELTQYCMAHNVTVADVLWANSVESADIKPGQALLLPANHADMLAIWQHKGAWQPTALVPVTSAAAAKRAAKSNSQLKEVPMPKIAGIPDLQTLNAKPAAPKASITDLQTLNAKPIAPKPQTPAEIPAPKAEIITAKTQPKPAETAKAPKPEAVAKESETPSEDTAPPAMTEKPGEKSNDDIIAMLREEVKTDARNLPPEMPEQAELSPHVDKVSEPEPVKAENLEPEPKPKPAKIQKAEKVQTVKIDTTAKKKNDSPAKVIANSAKPDKILTSHRKKSARAEIPGLMDPIIIFSPNGDPSQGPMRLVISGDKVEVVKLPKNATPKRPSLADLDHTFGTNPSYLPHYNMTPKPRDPFMKQRDPFLNMGNLAGKMLWPVDGKVSSPFGKWRGSHKHQGIDIPMPAGTPIRAAKNGVISRTGNNSTMGFRGYGNFVLMDHGDGVQTFYAHCLSVAVVEGQRVMQGQVVGYVGNTGRSTANHLHFEVRINNTKVNPIPYLAGNTSLAAHK